jgi:hypothetical protein
MPGPGGRLRGTVLLVGGIVGLLASPAGGGLRHRVRVRVGAMRAPMDPVEPFRQAPCYGGPPESAADSVERGTRALP